MRRRKMQGTNLDELVSGLPKAMGLTGFKLHIMENPGFDSDFEIILEAGRMKLQKADLMAKGDNILSVVSAFALGCVDKTDYLRDVRVGINNKLAQKDEEIEKLKRQIEELKVYKTHYDLEMKLRHGEKLIKVEE